MKTRTGQSQWPILMCCKDDMCNYMDTMDINIYVNTNNNGSYLKGMYLFFCSTCKIVVFVSMILLSECIICMS